MQKCISEDAQRLSRRGTFGNSFYHIGGTQSTPLSGDSQVTAFADEALFSSEMNQAFAMWH